MNPYVLGAVGVGVLLAVTGSDVAHAYEPFEEGYPVDYGQTEQANLAAFLAVLRLGESSDDYRSLYGGGRFRSFDDHPTFGEGFEGAIVQGRPTHAAGAYQFQPGTWREAQKALGLPDFSPESQDEAAVFLIRRRGALQAVKEGKMTKARELLTKEWASLPDRGDEWIAATFVANGGTLA